MELPNIGITGTVEKTGGRVEKIGNLQPEAPLSVTVPRPSAWSVPLPHSQSVNSMEPLNIGFTGRVEKAGGRVEKIGNLQPEASLSVTVPRPSAWSVPLLHSQTVDSMEPLNIGSNGRVEKSGGRVEEIEKQPTSFQAPIKRGSHTRRAIDILFANTAGGKFGAKFDAFIDEILPQCGIAPILYVLQERDREIIRSLT